MQISVIYAREPSRCFRKPFPGEDFETYVHLFKLNVEHYMVNLEDPVYAEFLAIKAYRQFHEKAEKDNFNLVALAIVSLVAGLLYARAL